MKKETEIKTSFKMNLPHTALIAMKESSSKKEKEYIADLISSQFSAEDYKKPETRIESLTQTAYSIYRAQGCVEGMMALNTLLTKEEAAQEIYEYRQNNQLEEQAFDLTYSGFRGNSAKNNMARHHTVKYNCDDLTGTHTGVDEHLGGYSEDWIKTRFKQTRTYSYILFSKEYESWSNGDTSCMTRTGLERCRRTSIRENKEERLTLTYPILSIFVGKVKALQLLGLNKNMDVECKIFPEYGTTNSTRIGNFLTPLSIRELVKIKKEAKYYLYKQYKAVLAPYYSDSKWENEPDIKLLLKYGLLTGTVNDYIGLYKKASISQGFKGLAKVAAHTDNVVDFQENLKMLRSFVTSKGGKL